MVDYTQKTYAKVGDRVRIEVAYSECAMHMRVAGTVMLAELLPSAWGAMVQLYRLDGREYSAPITTGEAGFYQDEGGYYYYPAEGVADV